MHTPPSQQQRQDTAQQEESPATPFGAGAGAAPSARGQGGTALRLKSALKPARLAAVQDEDGDEGTPTDAGIKKRVRIHSANNMIHEFQPSMSIDDAASLPGPLAGLRFSEGASDDEHTPDSSGPRRRRPPTPARPSLQRYRGFLAGVLNASSSSSSCADSGSRGGSRGLGSRGSARSTWGRDLLGMLFTLGWMLASSALIFANKQLMVDHGFRFPFALTAMGQASSTLPGEALGNGRCQRPCRAPSPDQRRQHDPGWLPCPPLLPRPLVAAYGHALLSCQRARACLLMPQPGWRRWLASRRCARRPRCAPFSRGCSRCRSALLPRCSWGTSPT